MADTMEYKAAPSETTPAAVGAEWAPVTSAAATVQPEMVLIDAINRSKVVVFLWRIAEGWPIEFVSENISQWGYCSADFYSEKYIFTNIVHPDDTIWLEKAVERLFLERAPNFSHTYRIFTSMGEVRWIDDCTIACFDAEGNITHYQGVIQDVTDRVAAEQSRAHLEEQMRQTQRMEAIGQLAGGIAHDFNNLMTPILGFSEFLMDRLDDPQLQDMCVRIQDAAKRAAQLTRQLLAFSRTQVLDMQVLDLTAVVKDFTRMLQTLLGEEFELRWALDPEAGCIEADLMQMQQVLMNLAINARDAMPNGGTLTITTASRADEMVRLSVRDSGCGIDESALPFIFEPFFTTKEVGKGTGLGLSTVYGIVQQHHGQITVESAAGAGTTFHLDFPRSTSAEVRQEPSLLIPASGSNGETILVADDSEPVRRVVGQILQAHGYTVLLAESGEQALIIAANPEVTIDLLLTDIVMKRINGRDTARALQRTRPTMAVVYMSGYTEQAFSTQTPREDGICVLAKPFTTQALLASLRAAFAATRARLS